MAICPCPVHLLAIRAISLVVAMCRMKKLTLSQAQEITRVLCGMPKPTSVLLYSEVTLQLVILVTWWGTLTDGEDGEDFGRWDLCLYGICTSCWAHLITPREKNTDWCLWVEFFFVAVCQSVPATQRCLCQAHVTWLQNSGTQEPPLVYAPFMATMVM